jgi:hypothetical protein
MLRACYKHAMANLQVKNVPEALHRKIRRLAKQEGKTLRDVVLDAVDRAVARAEWQQRHRTRERVVLDQPAARLVEQARAERDRELGTKR